MLLLLNIILQSSLQRLQIVNLVPRAFSSTILKWRIDGRSRLTVEINRVFHSIA